MTGFYRPFCSIVTLSAAIFLAGCSNESAAPAEAPETSAAESEHGHEHPHPHPHPHEEAGGHSHGDAPHDGTLADWGAGEYHVEFTVDHEKQQATVYILGDDAKTPVSVRADKVLLSIKEPRVQTDLLPVPQEGDAEGTSSRFVGTHEALGVVQEFAGVISAEVDGTPYSANFEEEAHGHDH